MKLSYKITEDYKNAFLQNRKAILIFFILTLISTLSTFNMANYLHPEMEIIIFILVMILGIFCILYYKIHNTELHKVAFVVILCFGLVFAFLSPMLIIPDEFEHFTHSEITSRGELFPEYVTASKEVPSWDGNHFQGYRTIGSVLDFAWNEWTFIRDHVCDNRPDSEWFENAEPDGSVTEKAAIVQPWKCPYHNGRMCIEALRRLKRIIINDI